MMSLMASGIPWSGPRFMPAAKSASAWRAAASAVSSAIWMNAPSFPLAACARASSVSVRVTALIEPLLSASAAAAMVRGSSLIFAS